MLSVGASADAANFTGADAETLNRLEQLRTELAVEWFGAAAPDWQNPVPVSVSRQAASGFTGYTFRNGWVVPRVMQLNGRTWAEVEDVARHEIMHLLLAEWIAQPLPRWIDEGLACCAERTRRDGQLTRYLRTGRGIPFNRMMAVQAGQPYPRDSGPFYAQSASAVDFLVERRGRPQFIRFVKHGVTYGWQSALSEVYGFRDSSDFQLQWVAKLQAAPAPETQLTSFQ